MSATAESQTARIFRFVGESFVWAAYIIFFKLENDSAPYKTAVAD